jgi:AraC-like DNA-binding protein
MMVMDGAPPEILTALPSAAAIELETVAGAPGPGLAGLVSALTGYREIARRPLCAHQPASLVFPLVISFGEPFRIGLGRRPSSNDRHSSFGAGLFAGPVIIESTGQSHCIQIDFTPLGARRFFNLPMSELAGAMIPLDEVCGIAGTALRERLGNTPDWAGRFALVRDFARNRIERSRALSPDAGNAFARLQASAGRLSIGRLAQNTGRSRKHLSALFRHEFGLPPKQIARIMRLGATLDRARRATEGWAELAVACGYADQAHLSRDFSELAGMTPTEWRAAA